MPIPALLAAAPGLLKAAGSLFGSRKRKRAEREAQRAQRNAINAVKNFEWSEEASNPWANVDNPFGDVTNTAADLTNPYADLKVNTQAAEFEAEQNAQNQANILDALVQGGASAGATATSLAGQATNANAKIAAGIAQQEAANNRLSAQGEAARQQQFAAGEARRQELFGRGLQWQQNAISEGEKYRQGIVNSRDEARQNQNLLFLNRADKQLASATAARTAARNQLFGGLSSALGGAISAGAFSKGGFTDSMSASDPFSSQWDIEGAVSNSLVGQGLNSQGYGVDDLGYVDLDSLD